MALPTKALLSLELGAVELDNSIVFGETFHASTITNGDQVMWPMTWWVGSFHSSLTLARNCLKVSIPTCEASQTGKRGKQQIGQNYMIMHDHHTCHDHDHGSITATQCIINQLDKIT
jgi:hypothetical protein